MRISILLLSIGTWALTQTEENALDTFHGRQLRVVIGVQYS